LEEKKKKKFCPNSVCKVKTQSPSVSEKGGAESVPKANKQENWDRMAEHTGKIGGVAEKTPGHANNQKGTRWKKKGSGREKK